MEKKRFKFIELPTPEIVISPEGESLLIGGLHCAILYTHCSNEQKSFCDLDAHGNGYDKNANCHGDPLGCSGTFYCHYNP